MKLTSPRYLLFILTLKLWFPITVEAQTFDFECGVRGPSASMGTAKVIFWNLTGLSEENSTPRDPAISTRRFALLRYFRPCMMGDVFLLHGASSPKVISQIFPLNDFNICFSGEFRSHTHDNIHSASIRGKHLVRPFCSNGSFSFEKPSINPAFSYVAFAVRRGSQITVESVRDVPMRGAMPHGELSAEGWALEVVLKRGDNRIRLLLFSNLRNCLSEDGKLNYAGSTECEAIQERVTSIRNWFDSIGDSDIPLVISGGYAKVSEETHSDPEGVRSSSRSVGDGLLEVLMMQRLTLKERAEEIENQCSWGFFLVNRQALAMIVSDSFWIWNSPALATEIQDSLSYCPVQIILRI